MELLFRKYDAQKCCLCGLEGALTGEHKIKASALRDEFGEGPLCIGSLEEQNQNYKIVQSTKSKHFHFIGRICAQCNGLSTQKPDRAFDRFHMLLKESFNSGDQNFWERGIFNHPDFSLGSENSNLLFRYFSKIICCRLAESEGPIPISVARHAIGEFDQNRIWLRVRREPTQEEYKAQHGAWPYAAHGGLIVYANEQTREPTGFHSTISIGPVQYIFWFRLNFIEKMELKFLHSKFHEYCRNTAVGETNIPNEEDKLKRLGLC